MLCNKITCEFELKVVAKLQKERDRKNAEVAKVSTISALYKKLLCASNPLHVSWQQVA